MRELFLLKRVMMIGLLIAISTSLVFAYITAAQAGEFLFRFDDQGPVLLKYNEFQPQEAFKYVIAPLVKSDLNGNLKASLRELYLDWRGRLV